MPNTQLDRYRIAVNAAAHAFCMDSVKAAREHDWSPDEMPKFIRAVVRFSAAHNKIPKRYWPEMGKVAVKFYKGHLAKALEELVSLQGRSNKHISNDTLDSLLKETGDLSAVNAGAVKKVLVIKIRQSMKLKQLSRLKFMKSMGIGGILMKWLTTPKYIGNVSLNTLLKAQTVLDVNLIDLSL